jgi:anti-sigma B factor antagonist
MDIKKELSDNITIFEIDGNLDSNTSGDLEKVLIPHIDGGGVSVLIDGTKLNYISSAGLRILLVAAKKIKAVNGIIVLCALQNHIKEVFDIAGFSKIFTIVPARDEALKKFPA